MCLRINNATGWVKSSSMKLRNSTLRSSTFWDVMPRIYGSLLRKFRDSLSVSSSRVKQSWTLRNVPEERRFRLHLGGSLNTRVLNVSYNFELHFENWSRQPDTSTGTFHIRKIWGSGSGGKWFRSLCTVGFWIYSEPMIQELSLVLRVSRFVT